MEQIGNTLHLVLDNIKAKNKKTAGENPGVWLKKVLTKKELEHVQFNYLSNGILAVNVDSSSWLYHLSLQKEEILGKLSNYSKAIKDIRFSIGRKEE